MPGASLADAFLPVVIPLFLVWKPNPLPELVDDMAPDKDCECNTLEILSWRKDNRTITRSTIPIHSLSDEPSALPDSHVSLIFTAADAVRECSTCRTLLSRTFSIPDIWWTPLARRSNGYFGYQDVLCPDGARTAITTWVRFIVKRLAPRDQYYWAKLNAFLHFLPPAGEAPDDSTPRTSVLVFDPHPTIAARPSSCSSSSPARTALDEASLPRDSLVRSLFARIADAELADPFWPYPRIVQDVLRVQDLAVWETTAFVRAVEKRRAFLTFNPNSSSSSSSNSNSSSAADLQQIPRHTLHVFETLCVAETTLRSIRDHHRLYLAPDEWPSPSTSAAAATPPDPRWPRPAGLASANIHHRLAHHHHILSSLRHRSASSLARVTTQITLTYNDIASRDAHLMRVDSSAMRAIAFVTMAFLPATFVSAVFGTGFFSYDPPTREWGVSRMFWIFCAVAVPVTAATMGAWIYWTRRFLHDPRAEDHGREVRELLRDAQLAGHGSVEKLHGF